MWAKILSVVFIVAFIFIGLSYKKTLPESQKPGDNAQTPIMREASNVIMYEKRLDSNKMFVIHAQSVKQETNELFAMNAFSVNRSDGMKITGNLARYDTGASVLRILGPITIITSDGWQASLTDLVWDRSNKHAFTDKPVKVDGEKGTITADRAEFFDDFNRVQLTGDVHAQVSRSIYPD
ncbi:hypothetical protein EG833_03840 [archaeon]|nr:hypothetical protein [archaeon]